MFQRNLMIPVSTPVPGLKSYSYKNLHGLCLRVSGANSI